METHAAQPAVGVQALQLPEAVRVGAGHPLRDQPRLALHPLVEQVVAVEGAHRLPLHVVDHGGVDAVAVHLLQQPGGVLEGGGPVVAVADADIGVDHLARSAEGELAQEGDPQPSR